MPLDNPNKISELYKFIPSGAFKDADEFASYLTDEDKLKEFFPLMPTGAFKDETEFLGYFGDAVKKKGISGQISATASQGISKPQEESLTPQPPLESDKEKGSFKQVVTDLTRSLKSGTFRTLGGIANTPIFLGRTVAGVTAKPIMKAMGASDDEANQMIDYLMATSTQGQSALEGEVVQRRLAEKARKTEEKMKPIEGTFEENIKKGDWGAVGEMVGRGFMQTLPYLAMTFATAGGGTAATLGTIGATSAAQQYGELEGEKESTRKLNGWLYGGFEAAGELVTAGLARGVGKAFRQGMTKTVQENFIKGASKEIAKGFGLEGSSEALTQIGQNLTDIVTGVDPERSVLDNVLFAGVLGGITGVGLGASQVGAHVIGRTLATDKEVTEVQDNVNQQGTLIDQIETTDKDPVKSALDKRLKTLKYEADKIMDKNYELAKTLSPEQANTVAELYSVWNDLQAKIDNKELVTEQEITTTEKAIEGVKAEIEGIKEAKIAELSEIKKEGAKFKIGDKHFETQEAVEAWLDKNYVKHGLEPVWHEATEKVIDNWVKQNKAKLEQEYTEKLQEEQKLKKEEETEEVPQESNIYNKQQVVESLLTEVPEESKEMMRSELTSLERDEFNKMATQAGFNNFGSHWTRETIAKESEQPPVQGEEQEVKHAEDIKTQFREVFGAKKVPTEQVEGAIALMDARAKSWASEEKGRTPEQWYQRIAGIKEGEFQDKATPKLYQLPDGRQVMGMANPEVTNGFYSPIEKRLTEFKQEKASVNKWKEIIGKGDEATFTGVLDYLNTLKPDQSLTKAEINQFMKDNRIEVVEVVKSDELPKQIFASPEEIESKKQRLEYLRTDAGRIPLNSPEYSKMSNEYGEIWSWLKENAPGWGKAEGDSVSPTKFNAYQLPGEKENYKEVLVTMPGKESQMSKRLGELERKDNAGTITEQEEIEYKRLRADRDIIANRVEFKSSHFDEPNILVHLRMNTRTDSEGKKVLFLEEVQSDWGQKGKKEGFATGTENYDKLIGDFNKRMSEKYNLESFYPYQRTGKRDELMNAEEKAELERISKLRRENNQIKGVPSAPFVTDTNAWVKLGLKTAMREAIKQGVDKIAWTTGEQQNERYDLSKQIDRVIYKNDSFDRKDGTYTILVIKDGRQVNDDIGMPTHMKPEKIEEYLGKEVAQKITNQEGTIAEDYVGRELKGENLRVGGKGMIGFYGSPQESKLGIVGNIAKSLFKQEPKTTKIKSDVESIEKSEIKKGVPEGWDKVIGEEWNLKYRLNGGFDGSERFKTKEQAEARLKELEDKYSQNQHSIDITPALKAEVEKGLPLFQKGKGKPKGAVETLADGKVIIHALSNPNFSTMVHEISHVFEKDLTPQEITTIESWSKKKQGTREFSEAFARGGERYLRDGVSPTKELTPIFEKFKKWLTDIYKSIKGSPIEKKLSPEVKKVFDRLLSESPQEQKVTDTKVEKSKPYLKHKDFSGLNNSPLNGLDQANNDAISFLNQYPQNFVGITESEGGAEKITGVTNQGGAKIENVSKFAVQLNFKNDRTKVMHFKTQEDLDKAVDKIYDFVNKKREVEKPLAGEEAMGRSDALDTAVKVRNSLGDTNPQYFYPNVGEGRYQTWGEFKKANKKIDEASLKEHWKKITGTYPADAPQELIDKMVALHDEVLRVEKNKEQETVQETKTFTEREQPTEVEQKVENAPQGQKEAILDTQTESEGGTPPPPKEPVKTQEKGQEGENEREKGFYKRLNESSTPSQDLKDAIQEKGLSYTVLNNNITQANIDFVISELGLEKAWEQCKDKGSALNGATRSGLSERLVVHYDKLASEAEKAGDLENEELYRNKALEIAEWKDDYGRDAGQFNQYSGSDECTKLMSPKTNVVRVKRSITKQREKKIESNKEDVKEKKDAMRKANKESADELVGSKEFEDLKRKVAELEEKLAEKPKPKKEDNARISKEKSYRAKEWDLFKKAGKTTASATIMGLNAEQIEHIGNIVASYVREGVYRTGDLIKKLQKDWFKNTGKILEADDAKKLLPDKVDGKTLAEIEKEGETKELAENLKEKVRKLLEDPKTPKDDPIKQLLDTLFQKIEEKDTAGKPAKEKKPTIEKIRQAIEDKERYADVWEKAKEKVLFMIDANPDLTEGQKSDQKKRIQSFFEEVIGKPYSEKQTEKATREKAKELDVDIEKVVRQHYTVLDATGRTLAEKLIEDAGVSGEQATMLAEAVQKQFNKIATERKKKILLRGLKARAKALTEPKKAKLEWEKLIELTNLGAFTSAEFAEAYAEIWGFPKLTGEQSKEIERLAGVIQEREGFKKDEAVRDYLNYLANIPGIDLGEIAMGWWYASILSGERTQFKNFFGNLTNTIFEATIGTIYNLGKGDFKVAFSMWAGLLGATSEAMTEFRYTLATGYSPVRYNKIEAAQVLERWKPKSWLNPVQYAKYVGRFMSATDAFFYIGLREMRAYELAMREARKINAEANVPSALDFARATELLFGTKQREAEAKLQAEQEGLTGISKKKRVWELMERSRGEAIVTESNNFASRGTYNYRPEGGLGMITEAIGRTVGGMEMQILNPFTGKKYTVAYGKFFVPFTRIIANVGNTALDYTPVGIKRSVSGRIGSPRKAQYHRELTSEERARTLIKATIGTSAAVILWFLSEPPDDGEEPVIQITAKGTGDYAKNQELAKSPNGWQQYSIKIGGTWYSYQYTPLFLILAPLGFIRDTQNYKKDKASTMKPIDVAVGGLSMFMSALSDMTALTTTSGLLETISSGDIPTTVAFWKKMSSSTVKGFIYPKAVEQTKQMINDFNDDPQRYSSSLLGKMVKDMPVIENWYPVQYNSFGEQVSFDAVQMLERPKTEDPVARYLVDNGAFLGTPDQRGDACIIYDSKLGVERGMNDVEYMRYVQTSGREIKNRIREDLMPRTDLTPEEVRKEITNIKTAVRKQAKAILFGWTKLREDHPEDWNTFIETEAVPVPQELVEVEVDDKKTRLSDEQLDEFNEKAIEYYRQGIISYLKDTATITRDKKDIDADTGESYFSGEIAEEWRKAKEDAKEDMENKLNNK